MADLRTAVAYPNIALIKYWGKEDLELNLPATGSLSLTLDVFPTTTTVQASETGRDEIVFNGDRADDRTAARIGAFLDLARSHAGGGGPVQITTANAGPTGAGLASSSSGFAALAAAVSAHLGLSLRPQALSRLARRGSGSASRSIFGGLALWPTGTDETSVAQPVDDHGLELAIVIVLIDDRAKSTSSRDGMQETRRSSPYHHAWIEQSTRDLHRARDAVARGDFDALGEVAEHNALAMHASMMATRPPIIYFRPGTLEVLDHVRDLRRANISVYATIDAGPNVKVICRAAQADAVAADLRSRLPGARILVARAGPGVVVTSRDGTDVSQVRR